MSNKKAKISIVPIVPIEKSVAMRYTYDVGGFKGEKLLVIFN